MNRAGVLAAFNEQVRRNTQPDGDATFETDEFVVRRIAVAGRGGSGVYWSALDERNADDVIAAQVAWFALGGESFEWKLYSYDQPPDLAARLVAGGLRPEEPESLMIGPVRRVLAELRDAAPPPGVRLELVTDEAGIDRLVDVHDKVFGTDHAELRASLLAGMGTEPPANALVLAVAGDQAVSSARIEFGPGPDFAGLWGGGTLPPWRGKGIYRALVRYRADLAVQRGHSYLMVDASDQSRPILERVGFECLATTTPYMWSPG